MMRVKELKKWGFAESTRGKICLFVICLVLLCETTVFFVSQGAYATGILFKDSFEEAPKRSTDGVFSIPEILVYVKNPVTSTDSMTAVLLTRWEHDCGPNGCVAAYLSKGDDGVFRMCACTKYTSILDNALKQEMDKARNDNEDMLTDFDDLSLDRKIEERCKYMNTYSGCVDVNSVIPAPQDFCNVFQKEERQHAVPLAFSSQTFFNPGVFIPMFGALGGMNVYVGKYGQYDATPIKGAVKQSCRRSLLRGTDCTLPKRDIGQGYMVYRNGAGQVCLKRRYGGNELEDCFPAPELQRPVVTAANNGNGVNLKFPDCKDINGEDSKYCNLTMNVGELDDEIGFSIIKPKIDYDHYYLTTKRNCANPQDDKSKQNECWDDYEEAQDGHVICVVNLPIRRQYYVPRNARYHWFTELPKVLVARSYDPAARRYVQCSDSKSVDLASMSQSDLNRLRTNGRTFHIPPPQGSVITSEDAKTVCKGNLTYMYSEYRAFEHDGDCRADDKEGVQSGYCKTRYESLDNFEPIFLGEKETVMDNALRQLNPILQGLCVHDFPSHEYEYLPNKNSASDAKRETSYTLAINKDNTTCDFLKVEMWGGGESGSLGTDGGIGRAGRYAMLILKVSGKANNFLSIKVGGGGQLSPGNEEAQNVKGENTEVAVCSDLYGQNCTTRARAVGGGNEGNYITNRGHMAHFRLSEGRKSVGRDSVFVPYQGEGGIKEGSALMRDVGCVRSDTRKDVMFAAPSAYFGAGGCADKVNRIVQNGANGRVKITCEKWAGPRAEVKKWNLATCVGKVKDTMEVFLKRSIDKNLSDKTQKFFTEIMVPEFCAEVATFPQFETAITGLLTNSSVNGQDILFKTVGESTAWVTGVVEPISKALDKESGVLDTYVAALGKPKTQGEIVEAKKRFLESFTELVRSKVGTYKDHKKVMKIGETFSNYAAKRNIQIPEILSYMKDEDLAKIVVVNKEFVEFLEKVETLMLGDSVRFKTASAGEEWLDKHTDELGKILFNDKELVEAYHKISTGNRVHGATSVRDVTEHLLAQFKSMLKKKIIVRDYEGEVIKALANFKKRALDNVTISRDVFAKIMNSNFILKAAARPEVVAALSSFDAILQGKQQSFNGGAEAAAWIEKNMEQLSNALLGAKDIIGEFENVRNIGRLLPASQKGPAQDLIAAFRELLETKISIDLNLALQILQENEKRVNSSELGLQPIAGVLFKKLANENVAKRVSMLPSIYFLFLDIHYVLTHKHSFFKGWDGDEYLSYVKDILQNNNMVNSVIEHSGATASEFREGIQGIVERVVKAYSVPFSEVLSKLWQDIQNTLLDKEYRGTFATLATHKDATNLAKSVPEIKSLITILAAGIRDQAEFSRDKGKYATFAHDVESLLNNRKVTSGMGHVLGISYESLVRDIRGLVDYLEKANESSGDSAEALLKEMKARFYYARDAFDGTNKKEAWNKVTEQVFLEVLDDPRTLELVKSNGCVFVTMRDYLRLLQNVSDRACDLIVDDIGRDKLRSFIHHMSSHLAICKVSTGNRKRIGIHQWISDNFDADIDIRSIAKAITNAHMKCNAEFDVTVDALAMKGRRVVEYAHKLGLRVPVLATMAEKEYLEDGTATPQGIIEGMYRMIDGPVGYYKSKSQVQKHVRNFIIVMTALLLHSGTNVELTKQLYSNRELAYQRCGEDVNKPMSEFSQCAKSWIARGRSPIRMENIKAKFREEMLQLALHKFATEDIRKITESEVWEKVRSLTSYTKKHYPKLAIVFELMEKEYFIKEISESSLFELLDRLELATRNETEDRAKIVASIKKDMETFSIGDAAVALREYGFHYKGVLDKIRADPLFKEWNFRDDAINLAVKTDSVIPLDIDIEVAYAPIIAFYHAVLTILDGLDVN